MSETIGHMTSLELRQAKNGRLYWVDSEAGVITDKEALHLLNGVVEGVDTEMKQEPVKAIWHTEDKDMPVTVTGSIGHLDGEEYLAVGESSTGIPRSELVWLPPEAPPARSPSTAETTESENKKSDREELKSEIEELKKSVSELAKSVERLAEEVRELLENGPKKSEEAPTSDGDHKTVFVEMPDGQVEGGWSTVTNTLKSVEDEEVLLVEKDGKVMLVEREKVFIKPPEKTKPAESQQSEEEGEEEELRKHGFRRNQKVGVRRGRTENFILGYQVAGLGETDEKGRLKIKVRSIETGREFDYYPGQLEDEEKIAEEHGVRMSEPEAADRAAAAAATTEARTPLPPNITRREVYRRTEQRRGYMALGAAVLSLFAGGVFGVLVQENLLEGPEPPAKTVTVPPKIIVEGNGIHKVFKSPNGTVIIKTGTDNEKSEEQAETSSEPGRSVYIGYGEGYTQAIQDLYPGHSGSAYYRAYDRLMDRIGPNALKGVGHYVMSSGNWGLSRPGQAYFTRSAIQVLNKFFGNN